MNREIAIIGLGYVGLSLAVALSKKFTVYGYDISEARINELRKSRDRNLMEDSRALEDAGILFTTEITEIARANFFIVTVSTPAYYYELPNLEPLTKATQAIASIIKKGDIVVYESTVYPGTTEEICLPILEEGSKLRAGIDFHLGYSPERISPHDKDHNLKNIVKIISAQNEPALKVVESVYRECCDNLFPVSNIKTAEAAKILENTQRDINIAFMNEFSQIMHGLDLNVHEIISAAKTKWNFIDIKPGLVGGHCISVDPLYLAFKAKRLGIGHDLILTARKVNDNISQFIISQLQKLLIKNEVRINRCRIGIFGITYKENTPDVRNSMALKLIKELKMAGFDCQVNDPLADKKVVKEKYQLDLLELEDIHGIAAAIIAVGHDEYRNAGLKAFTGKFQGPIIIMDIPNIFVNDIPKLNKINYWSL